MKKELFLIIFYIFLAVLFLSNASAAEFNHVISNSDNWRDVYSTILYANLNMAGSDFLVSPRHSTLLMNGLNRQNSFLIITSKKRAFVVNYADLMKGRGFSSVEEIKVDAANLDLIEEMKEINNFVIVGNTYGYSAMAVAPYAKIKKSWVFFADRTNIDEIDSILSERNVNELIIYGYVDREVRESLGKYNPKVIDTGDRFMDNIEIVKKYLEISPTRQIALSNGEFIEKELMSGMEPVLFTGKENVPDQIRDYIKSSDFEVGVLVGSDLVGAATNIRRSTGISVIVKFARGARAPTGAVSNVEGLDLFYLPVPNLQLLLYNARYNRASNQLEITYKSESNVPVYFKGTVTYTDSGGERTRTGDVEPIFIAPRDYKTVSYSDLKFEGNNLTLDIFTLYGETFSSLEKVLERSIQAEIVNVIDKCEIDLKTIRYNRQKGEFTAILSNKGNVDCWADVELLNLLADGRERTIGNDGAVGIEAGKSRKIPIKFEMSAEDLKRNEFVNVIVYYGEREDSLTKSIRGKLKLEIEMLSAASIYLIAAALAILLLIVFFTWRRKKDDFKI